MRRVIAFFTAVLLLISCHFACAESTDELYEQGLRLIALMEEMTESNVYCSMLTTSDSLQPVMKQLSECDYDAPCAVARLQISEDLLVEMLNEMMADVQEINDPSEELRKETVRKLKTALITQLSAGQGVEKLAVSSMFTAQKCFMSKGNVQDEIYFYFYENCYPVAVLFNVGEDNAVLATGQFMLAGEPTEIELGTLQKMLNAMFGEEENAILLEVL